MTLFFYIVRRFLTMFGLVFGSFLGILLLIDTIDQMRRYSEFGITSGESVYLAALNLPTSLYQILPLLIILSAIALFIGLARSSELVVVRASGRSGLRFLLAPVGTVLVLGILSVAIVNPFVAATTQQYAVVSAQYSHDGGAILSISEEGLWLRQGASDNSNDQTVIRAARSSPDGAALNEVTFITFSAEGLPTSRIEALSARLEPGAWVLSGAKRWSLTAENPERDAVLVQGDLHLPTELTSDRLKDSVGRPSSVAFWDLPTYIAGLEHAGFAARNFRVWYQMELALPLLLISMILIAAGFTMRRTRTGGTGKMVLFALMSGFMITFLRSFAQVLGEDGQIPIIVAAWSPPIAAILMATGLLLHMEDG